MRNPYHKSMHRSRVIPVFECIVPTFCQILKIAKALDFTAFQRFNRPIGRTKKVSEQCVPILLFSDCIFSLLLNDAYYMPPRNISAYLSAMPDTMPMNGSEKLVTMITHPPTTGSSVSAAVAS